MKTLFAGLCLVFTTLFSCQQKEGQFKSVSVDDFSTLIANPEVQLLDAVSYTHLTLPTIA